MGWLMVVIVGEMGNGGRDGGEMGGKPALWWQFLLSQSTECSSREGGLVVMGCYMLEGV